MRDEAHVGSKIGERLIDCRHRPVQEFLIVDGDTSTKNYAAVRAELDVDPLPEGLIAHTAGFDHDKRRLPDPRCLGNSPVLT